MTPSALSAPLIITAVLPGTIQSRADTLRRAHFPALRNHLSAHVTLFHALPPSALVEVKAALANLASRRAPAARLSGIMNLGGGTALAIDSPEMMGLRDELADLFHGLLSAQDRGRPRLHVTVQNKVPPADARRLQAHLAETFRTEHFRFAGLALHRYLGGPWESAGIWKFRG